MLGTGKQANGRERERERERERRGARELTKEMGRLGSEKDNREQPEEQFLFALLPFHLLEFDVFLGAAILGEYGFGLKDVSATSTHSTI